MSNLDSVHSENNDDQIPHWTESTQQVMMAYLDRWVLAVKANDAQAMGTLTGELWDRIVINPDEPELRLGIAAVGAKIIGDMQLSVFISGEALPEKFLALGDVFAQILLGERVTFEVHNASGETRLLTFEKGVRTMAMPDGSPPLMN